MKHAAEMGSGAMTDKTNFNKDRFKHSKVYIGTHTHTQTGKRLHKPTVRKLANEAKNVLLSRVIFTLHFKKRTAM
jgi:hypothetical protein